MRENTDQKILHIWTNFTQCTGQRKLLFWRVLSKEDHNDFHLFKNYTNLFVLKNINPVFKISVQANTFFKKDSEGL